MRPDRQTYRQTNYNTSQPKWGEVVTTEYVETMQNKTCIISWITKNAVQFLE